MSAGPGTYTTLNRTYWKKADAYGTLITPDSTYYHVLRAHTYDYSDSHGLCYGMVFPNLKGSCGREKYLEVFWFEPEEIEIKG